MQNRKFEPIYIKNANDKLNRQLLIAKKYIEFMEEYKSKLNKKESIKIKVSKLFKKK